MHPKREKGFERRFLWNTEDYISLMANNINLEKQMANHRPNRRSQEGKERLKVIGKEMLERL